MKKKISCILGFMVLAASLSGCGEKKDEQATTKAVTTETTVADDTTAEATTEATTEATKVDITAPAEGSARVKGEAYTFSADNGIDNWGDIAEGNLIQSGMSYIFYPLDGSGAIEVEYGEHKNYPVVFQRSPNVEVSGVTIGNGVFYLYDDYVLSDGVTSAVTGDDLISKGYMQINDSDYYMIYFTSSGYVSFSDIEADYEKIVSENSFKGLEYCDILGELAPDRVKSNYNTDDVAGAIEMFSTGGDAKMQMMDWLAKAKCTKQLIDGKIDYYICQNVKVNSADGAEVSLVFSVKDEYINKWMANWGVKQ